ncbi:protein L7/L12 [Seminavis robusta]|uniref:Protein L7/L12 n=1 Tax=Seminavis robusta TaxID=568900 RepID=A0A9N8DBP0_9STRA|nr:protein L7/L12 [Seminavis robusta]|eukprot:Sro25_g017190.1 protein L7/L12 (201) ;mRNA; r:130335-130937
MLPLIVSSTSLVLRKRLLTPPSCRIAQAWIHSSSVAQHSAGDQPPIRRRNHELSQESKDKVERIFQKILWLDTIEVHLITELINQKMGLILTPKERASLQKEVDRQLAEEAGETFKAAGSNVEEEAEKGPSTVDLKLTGFDDKSKIKVIKEVRSIAGLGLKEAKELVESAPKIIQKELKPELAEELKEKLEAVGAKIELV